MRLFLFDKDTFLEITKEKLNYNLYDLEFQPYENFLEIINELE